MMAFDTFVGCRTENPFTIGADQNRRAAISCSRNYSKCVQLTEWGIAKNNYFESLQVDEFPTILEEERGKADDSCERQNLKRKVSYKEQSVHLAWQMKVSCVHQQNELKAFCFFKNVNKYS